MSTEVTRQYGGVFLLLYDSIRSILYYKWKKGCIYGTREARWRLCVASLEVTRGVSAGEVKKGRRPEMQLGMKLVCDFHSPVNHASW